MPKPVLLNNVEHKNLRVITRRGARFGDAQMAAPTFPAEFRNIQACYPIVFRQTTDGAGFEPIALLGFQEGENLFLQGCLLYTSPSPRDRTRSRMPSSA